MQDYTRVASGSFRLIFSHYDSGPDATDVSDPEFTVSLDLTFLSTPLFSLILADRELDEPGNEGTRLLDDRRLILPVNALWELRDDLELVLELALDPDLESILSLSEGMLPSSSGTINMGGLKGLGDGGLKAGGL